MSLSRTRDEGCLSDLALDRLLRDEPSPAAGAARAHLAACEKCRARMAELEAERAAFRAAPPPLRRPAPRRRLGRALGAAAAGLAAAAAFALLLRPEEGTRAKGGPSIGVWVEHDGRLRRAQSGERVAPGDFVQLTYSGAAPLYGAILSLDGAGRVSRYFPDEEHAAALAPGSAQRFPRSTQLDDVLGRETVYALLCREPVALKPLLDALAAGRAPAQPGCYVERVELDKERP